MKRTIPNLLTLISLALIWVGTQNSRAGDDESASVQAAPARISELDAYWEEVARAVRTGDFEAYKATCHPEGVLVSGRKRKSYPLSEALQGWKSEFADTSAGKMKASVEFRFSQRYGDATTAHETGIFLYSATDADGQKTRAFVNFEALLVKRAGKWQILMEYQKSEATAEDWSALAPAPPAAPQPRARPRY